MLSPVLPYVLLTCHMFSFHAIYSPVSFPSNENRGKMIGLATDSANFRREFLLHFLIIRPIRSQVIGLIVENADQMQSGHIEEKSLRHVTFVINVGKVHVFHEDFLWYLEFHVFFDFVFDVFRRRAIRHDRPNLAIQHQIQTHDVRPILANVQAWEKKRP